MCLEGGVQWNCNSVRTKVLCLVSHLEDKQSIEQLEFLFHGFDQTKLMQFCVIKFHEMGKYMLRHKKTPCW